MALASSDRRSFSHYRATRLSDPMPSQLLLTDCVPCVKLADWGLALLDDFGNLRNDLVAASLVRILICVEVAAVLSLNFRVQRHYNLRSSISAIGI